ncbi:MAG: hypothetical protein VB862_02165, partial [Pirellulaceae bacterium]
MNDDTIGSLANWPVIDELSPVEPANVDAPLEALSRGEIAAIICRQAFTQEACDDVVKKLVREGLLFDPALPLPENLKKEAIPENYYYRPGETSENKQDRLAEQPTGRLRIDVGTSLGTRGSKPASFFEHASQTQQLFSS